MEGSAFPEKCGTCKNLYILIIPLFNKHAATHSVQETVVWVGGAGLNVAWRPPRQQALPSRGRKSVSQRRPGALTSRGQLPHRAGPWDGLTWAGVCSKVRAAGWASEAAPFKEPRKEPRKEDGEPQQRGGDPSLPGVSAASDIPGGRVKSRPLFKPRVEKRKGDWVRAGRRCRLEEL